MHQKDLKIIAHLRKDSRIPLTRLSRKTKIPVSTIFDRLKAKEKDVIIKHTSLLDFNKLGFHTRANIAIRVEREDKDKIKEHLIKHEAINSVCRINNGYDYMIEGIFKQIKDMEEFLDILENKFRILDKKTFFIIEDLMKEEFMADPQMMFHK